MTLYISSTEAPDLQTLMGLGSGDLVSITACAFERSDWGSLIRALTTAILNGASIDWEE